MKESLNLIKVLNGLDGNPAKVETTVGDIPVTIKEVLVSALNINTPGANALDTVEKVYKRGQLIETVKTSDTIPLTAQLAVTIQNVLIDTGQTPTTVYQILQEMGVDPTV